MSCPLLQFPHQVAFEKILSSSDRYGDRLDTSVWAAAHYFGDPDWKQEQRIYDPSWHHPAKEYRDHFLWGRNVLARHIGRSERTAHNSYSITEEPLIPFTHIERIEPVVSCPHLGHADWQGLARVLEFIDEGISILEGSIWSATSWTRHGEGGWPTENEGLRKTRLFDPEWDCGLKIDRDKWLICRNLLARHLGLRDRGRHEIAPNLGYRHEYGMLVKAA